LEEIGGDEAAVHLDRPCFFGKNGVLSIPLNEFVYEWGPGSTGGRWTSRPLDKSSEPALTNAPKATAPVGVALEPVSAVCDSVGVTWFTDADGDLYKAVPGRIVRAFPEHYPRPFRWEKKLYSVLNDPHGGAVIQVRDYAPFHLVHVPLIRPAPKAAATLITAAWDRTVVHPSATQSSADPGGEVWFSWSLDGTPWEPVQKTTELTFTDLKPGRHRLQVRGFNAELGTEPEPVVLEWKTR
jgi:hypothetical protein